MASYCEHCGGDPVPHFTRRMSVRLDELLSPLLRLAELFSSFGTGGGDAFLDGVMRLMERTGLAELPDEPDEKDFKYVAHVLYEAARLRGIDMRHFRPFGIPLKVFTARKGSEVVVFERLPIPKRRGRGVHWLDDKARMREEFGRLGLPIARGGVARTRRDAQALFERLAKPLIVKPHRGSGTRHTTLHIDDAEVFLEAFRIAREVSPRVVVEEELAGFVYRPTVVGGSLAATIERRQPFVVGDGSGPVGDLIERENGQEKRSGPIFSKIRISQALLSELARQGHALTSVPKVGERVFLHQKINWSVGGTTRDVSDAVHPENRTLFEKVAGILRAPVVGIDFIVGDISRPWHEQKRTGIIEVNSMPFIDTHHLPFEGRPRDVAGALWDEVFPKG